MFDSLTSSCIFDATLAPLLSLSLSLHHRHACRASLPVSHNQSFSSSSVRGCHVIEEERAKDAATAAAPVVLQQRVSAHHHRSRDPRSLSLPYSLSLARCSRETRRAMQEPRARQQASAGFYLLSFHSLSLSLSSLFSRFHWCPCSLAHI